MTKMTPEIDQMLVDILLYNNITNYTIFYKTQNYADVFCYGSTNLTTFELIGLLEHSKNIIESKIDELKTYKTKTK